MPQRRPQPGKVTGGDGRVKSSQAAGQRHPRQTFTCADAIVAGDASVAPTGGMTMLMTVPWNHLGRRSNDARATRTLPQPGTVTGKDGVVKSPQPAGQ